MSIKKHDTVRIKGFAQEYKVAGVYGEAVDIRNVGGGFFAVPTETLEVVAEPITASFEPVSLPLTVDTWYAKLTVRDNEYDSGGSVTLSVEAGNGQSGELQGKNLNKAEAVKLAHAILTWAGESE